MYQVYFILWVRDDEREFLVFPNPGSAVWLGPIAEYLKNFALEWDPKAFKKQQDQTDSKITRLLKGDTDWSVFLYRRKKYAFIATSLEIAHKFFYPATLQKPFTAIIQTVLFVCLLRQPDKVLSEGICFSSIFLPACYGKCKRKSSAFSRLAFHCELAVVGFQYILRYV